MGDFEKSRKIPYRSDIEAELGLPERLTGPVLDYPEHSHRHLRELPAYEPVPRAAGGFWKGAVTGVGIMVGFYVAIGVLAWLVWW